MRIFCEIRILFPRNTLREDAEIDNDRGGTRNEFYCFYFIFF